MDTLLATVCLPRWRHDRGHRHHAAFPLPSRNCTVSHSPALAPIPERGIEKRAQGGLVRKQLRFLEVVSAATGSPWPRWLLPACGSPRPLAITIANGIRLPSTLCRWGGGKASAAFPKLALQALFEAEPQPEWPVSLRVTAIREPVSLQTRCNLSGEMQLTTCRHETGFMYKEISFRSMSEPGRISAPGFALGAVRSPGVRSDTHVHGSDPTGPPWPNEAGNHMARIGSFWPLNLRMKKPL
jgi:hypothetical protein